MGHVPIEAQTSGNLCSMLFRDDRAFFLQTSANLFEEQTSGKRTRNSSANFRNTSANSHNTSANSRNIQQRKRERVLLWKASGSDVSNTRGIPEHKIVYHSVV